MWTIRTPLALSLVALPALAQSGGDPFPAPIEATEGVVRVSFREFASLPEIEGVHARTMLLVDEPGTRRLFVNDMRGPLYSLGYEGGSATLYLDVDDPRWGVPVQSAGRERGFQSFALHPQFAEPGAPGFGKLYTWTDTEDTAPRPDFSPGGGSRTHDTVLLEWTARDPRASAYDGGPPRELARFEQPFANHNAGHLTFRPGAAPGDADFGLLYVGVGDGGSGGDPLDLSQDLGSAFGKILRLDPLGSNSANGRYGIPADNPFAGDGDDSTLGEVFVYGVRNPQRFAWDPRNGNLFVADIGQNQVEELSLAAAGANLGWNDWEGSFRFVSRTELGLDDPRGDPGASYPVAEYGHSDPLLLSRAAVTGVHVYRDGDIPQLRDLVLFGDFPSGEIFYLHADRLPDGGQDGIRRVLLDDGGEAKTLLQLVREKNAAQGRPPAERVDLRFGAASDGRLFLLDKHDGTIRLLVP
jgi:hypothetical protein